MNKPTILVTGFGPFAGVEENPVQAVVETFPEPNDFPFVVERRVLEVSYAAAVEDVTAFVAALRPGAVVLTGLAETRSEISIERLASNIRHSTEVDNDGIAAFDEAIEPGGPDIVRVTTPSKDILTALAKNGINAGYSYSAGTYVCNYVLYRTLRKLTGTGVLCGFFHFPPFARNGEPGTDIVDMRRALQLIVDVTAKSLDA